MLSAMLMACGQHDPVGQVVFTSSGGVQAIFSWTVPARVTSIFVVCVGLADYSKRSAVQRYDMNLYRGWGDIFSSAIPLSGAVGGGTGGTSNAKAGGGAGGYSGNGGSGSTSSGTNGGAGAGGAAGGGAPGYMANSTGVGGGVGLLGAGASGAGGPSGTEGGSVGGNGSIPPGVNAYGAGTTAENGCDLRYTITPLSVTPGEVMQIFVKGRAVTSAPTTGGAVRIMWGGGRSYPNNAGDLPEVL